MEMSRETYAPQEDLRNDIDTRDYSVFTSSMQFYLTYFLGFIIILSTLTATIYFPLIPLLSREFSVSVQAINLTVTLYAVCQGLTPPVFASLADSFGRRPMLLGLVALYACASLGLAVNRDSYGVLLALRALQSVGGSATPAIAYGIVADVAVVSERGRMLGPMLSTCNGISAIGPVIGGVVAQSTGAYTWVFLSLCIVALTCFVLIGLTLPETARPIVGDGSGIPPTLSKLWWTGGVIMKYGTIKPEDPEHAQHQTIPKTEWRPAMLLESLRIIFYPDAAAVLWMIATSYCVYYTFQVAIPVIYADIYGYDNLQIGLAFLPGLTGMTIGGIVAGKLLDRNFALVARNHNFPVDRKRAQELSDFPLEAARYRCILPFVALEVALVAGYGWAVQRQVHPAALLVMQFFICASSTLLSHTASALLVDVFPSKSSTSYAAGQLMRCGLSAASAAVLEPLTGAVGRGWYFTLFAIFTGFSAIVCVFLTIAKGKTWRRNRQASQ
ncbi:major facilitator superfamily domain-containing protein [Truncatella angustata]|uniref:Major facilitator superfamily domain-containing protein n=1 Tax=Truncatella angustata TaxID=152316 RepID=A0A9P8UQD5_9PEZI|nr:major facilitator superfamily domain-containing protein [Truncatella angustata]KAH6656266.1 major facilitator superfamily domain-containing protein [Truncatella angustata]